MSKGIQDMQAELEQKDKVIETLTADLEQLQMAYESLKDGLSDKEKGLLEELDVKNTQVKDLEL